MSVPYITLKSGSLEKKFRVLRDGYTSVLQKAQSVKRTINRELDLALGGVYRLREMIIRVKAEEPVGSEYGTRQDLEAFYKLNTPSSAAILLTDHFGEAKQVVMVGDLKNDLLTVVIDGQDAVYLYKCQFLDIEAVA